MDFIEPNLVKRDLVVEVCKTLQYQLLICNPNKTSFPFPPCVLPSALVPVDFSIHAVVAPFAFVSLVPHT